MTVSFAQMFGTQSADTTMTLPQRNSQERRTALMNADGHLTTPRIFDDEIDPKALADEDLAREIEHCGIQLLASNKLYQEFKTQEMKDARAYWLKRQSKALWERSRRPQMVAAMHAQIEARMAREPGMK